MNFNPWNDVIDAFGVVQQTVFEIVVQPLVYQLDLTSNLEEAFAGTGLFLAGCVQILILMLVLSPLQRLWPVAPIRNRRAVRTDVLYTLLHRLGLLQLLLFFTLDPVFDAMFALLHAHGMAPLQLDSLLDANENGALSFAVYLIVFDIFGYLIHRLQHRFHWWWALHSLHHSQRDMTVWTDDRNHLLDDVIQDALLATLAHLIGIGPAQYIGLICATQLLQSLQHANLRWSFGRIGERLLISPRFHRMHHAIGIGHEARGRVDTLGGCNFGILFPWWDMLFGTANFDPVFAETGIRDQVEQGRDYGEGFWRQQWLGLQRLWYALSPTKQF